MVQFLGNAVLPSGHEQVYKQIGRPVTRKVPCFVPGKYFRLNGNVALSEKENLILRKGTGENRLRIA